MRLYRYSGIIEESYIIELGDNSYGYHFHVSKNNIHFRYLDFRYEEFKWVDVESSAYELLFNGDKDEIENYIERLRILEELRK